MDRTEHSLAMKQIRRHHFAGVEIRRAIACSSCHFRHPIATAAAAPPVHFHLPRGNVGGGRAEPDDRHTSLLLWPR
jgi:hypothetical protein